MLPWVNTTSRRQGYTKRYPFWVQIEQLHLLIGYLGKGHLSVTENWTAPQWQDAWWVMRSASEVGSTMEKSVTLSGLGASVTNICEIRAELNTERGNDSEGNGCICFDTVALFEDLQARPRCVGLRV